VGTTWGARDADDARARLVRIVARLPEASVEDVSEHGHTGFTTRGTKFTWLTVDHHDDGRLAVWIRSTREDQQALVRADPDRFFVPPYSGAQGWVAALVDPASDPDWDVVAELVETGWRRGATKRAIAARDAALAEADDADDGGGGAG